jgi:hypothetical protein
VTAQTSVFRGYKSIQEAMDHIKPLAEWMKANRPTCKRITLKGPEYDLIQRWPKAAKLFGIQVTETSIIYDGFEFGRDKKPQRYGK